MSNFIYRPANAVETCYRGCRFRSRLEARWAVFFDHLGIGWRYEPEGFDIDGRWYLPDFLLECGTWVEVKAPEAALEKDFLRRAALRLPQQPATGEPGPGLLILGPHPMVSGEWIDPRPGDWGWLGLGRDGCTDELHAGNYGFGLFRARRRLWYWEDRPLDEPWLQPEFDPDHEDTQDAYTAANSARFEHGEKGWLR